MESGEAAAASLEARRMLRTQDDDDVTDRRLRFVGRAGGGEGRGGGEGERKKDGDVWDASGLRRVAFFVGLESWKGVPKPLPLLFSAEDEATVVFSFTISLASAPLCATSFCCCISSSFGVRCCVSQCCCSASASAT